ncbi:MAG: NAD(P)/FAD-dependent oxidoreductase [Terriglobales bacterium]
MTNLYDTDVFIVGGGPAGLAAAIAARQHGLRCMVADCASPPIDKACGEGLMPDSLDVLQDLGVSLLGLETGSFRGIKFVGPEGSVAAEFPHGLGVGIRRVLLHQAFVEHAARCGVEMLWQTRVSLVDHGSVQVNGTNVRCKWIIGADGQNSQVRQWAGLDEARVHTQRIGSRQHFRVKPWSPFVEIYWGERGQAYVTPIGRQEVCVALISRDRFSSFDAGVEQVPGLGDHLKGAERSTSVRGALTVARRLKSVARGNVALIGEAAGSVDAITGEGLAMAFRQALALAPAMVAGNLSSYQKAHWEIMGLPGFMSRSMLLLDNQAWLRRRALRAFAREPRLFERLLSVHVGATPLASVGARNLANLGWQVLTA